MALVKFLTKVYEWSMINLVLQEPSVKWHKFLSRTEIVNCVQWSPLSCWLAPSVAPHLLGQEALQPSQKVSLQPPGIVPPNGPEGPGVLVHPTYTLYVEVRGVCCVFLTLFRSVKFVHVFYPAPPQPPEAHTPRAKIWIEIRPRLARQVIYFLAPRCESCIKAKRVIQRWFWHFV